MPPMHRIGGAVQLIKLGFIGQIPADPKGSLVQRELSKIEDF